MKLWDFFFKRSKTPPKSNLLHRFRKCGRCYWWLHISEKCVLIPTRPMTKDDYCAAPSFRYREDRLFEVEYLYNVTGAVQRESVLIWSKSQEEAWLVTQQLLKKHRYIKVFDPTVLSIVEVAPDGVENDVKRTDWEPITGL